MNEMKGNVLHRSGRRGSHVLSLIERENVLLEACSRPTGHISSLFSYFDTREITFLFPCPEGDRQ